MKINILKALIIVLVGYILFFLASCNFAPYQGEAQIVLDLGWLFPGGDGSADGARSGSVSGQGVPPNIAGYVTSLQITVSGAGMSTTTRTYTRWPDTLSVSVEPGKERTVGVRINISPACDSSVLAFGGEGTVKYLSAGQLARVLIPIAPVETKIVIPDCNNWRIVQLSSLNPATADWQQYQLVGFFPIDVDFDSKGRIVVVNNAGTNQITILDDYTTSHLTLNAGTLTSTAVDRENHYFYFSNNTTVFRYQYSTDEIRLQATTIGSRIPDPRIAAIRGMAVDEFGLLYLVCSLNNEWHVAKYDYDNNIFTLGPLLQSPWDVIVKGNYVYVTCSGTPALVKVNRNMDPASIVNYGQAAANNTDNTPGHFHGPRNFLAIMNKKFYIVDDGGAEDPNPSPEQIIAFDSPDSWQGWEAKLAGDIKAGEAFVFYNC
jgi:hypothetical protein